MQALGNVIERQCGRGGERERESERGRKRERIN